MLKVSARTRPAKFNPPRTRRNMRNLTRPALADFKSGLGTWPFGNRIVKIWPFSEVVWSFGLL